MRKKGALNSVSTLNPLHFNEDGEMIWHQVVPMEKPSDGVYWCQVCGGHPDDPIHQPGWREHQEDGSGAA